ncbi:MAG: hypothetical protein ACXIUL_06145 [Wenzhouxiangella sp.]
MRFTVSWFTSPPQLCATAVLGLWLASPLAAADRLDLTLQAGTAPGQSIKGLEQGEVRMVSLNQVATTVSYRQVRFRGSPLLALQLGTSEGFQPDIQLDRDLPSRHWLADELRVDAYPHGWLERYCRVFEAIESPVRPPAEAFVMTADQRMLSPRDWDGHSPRVLEVVHDPQADSGWTVSRDSENDTLLFKHHSGLRLQLASPRADMPAVRYQRVEGELIQFGYTPSGYDFPLCRESLADASENPARLEALLSDYFFGAANDAKNGPGE